MFNFLKNKKERDLTRQELRDLQHLNNLCVSERFKADQIKNNTVYFKNGQAFAAQQEALATLLENVKSEMVAAKLSELGYEKGCADFNSCSTSCFRLFISLQKIIFTS